MHHSWTGNPKLIWGSLGLLCPSINQLNFKGNTRNLGLNYSKGLIAMATINCQGQRRYPVPGCLKGNLKITKLLSIQLHCGLIFDENNFFLSVVSSSPFYLHGLSLIPAWISNCCTWHISWDILYVIYTYIYYGIYCTWHIFGEICCIWAIFFHASNSALSYT